MSIEASNIVATMKQALKVLEDIYWRGEWIKKRNDAITSLRQAIAEESSATQEPVAWMRKDETCTDCFVWEKDEDHTVPLYTHPQPKEGETK